MTNLQYLLALHSVDGLGPIRLKKVLEYFGDPKVAWEATLSDFKNLGIPENVFENLKEKRKSLDPNQNLEYLKKLGIKALTLFDENYPKGLKEIYDPPIVIYYKGQFLEKDQKAFAVVGTRKITGYGREVTKKLTSELVEVGFTIVSGLARGVDTVAHQSALETNGRTIAVLAGGLNLVFPSQNIDLAKKIADDRGVCLSEFPPDYPHLAGNFPSRNRIIAGLSIATLVTEAAEDSGSLITARLALDQGKEVFAIPGPITSSLSEGPAQLIKQGAKLVTNISDILDELGIESSHKKPESRENLNLTKLEEQILESLKNEQKHIDDLCRENQLKSSEVSAALIKMEIIGLVKNLGGGNYTKSL